MEKIKQAYYYLFYKIYKSIQYASAPLGEFWTDSKTSIVIIALEIWTIFSFINYYDIFYSSNSELIQNEKIWILIVGILVLIDYVVFHSKEQWKEILSKFDKLPKKKNTIGGWVVSGGILLVIGNFIFSFYLLFAQARKDQTGPYAPEIVAKKRKEDSLQKAQQIENLKKIYGEDKK